MGQFRETVDGPSIISESGKKNKGGFSVRRNLIVEFQAGPIISINVPNKIEIIIYLFRKPQNGRSLQAIINSLIKFWMECLG